jgi:hypothetical protein
LLVVEFVFTPVFTARRETLSAKTLKNLLTAETAEKNQRSQREQEAKSRAGSTCAGLRMEGFLCVLCGDLCVLCG